MGKAIGATTAVTMPIPALDGKSIAKTVTVEVPCTVDRVTGEEILGPEALETMDRVKALYMRSRRGRDGSEQSNASRASEGGRTKSA